MRLIHRPEDPLDEFLGKVRNELHTRIDAGGRARDFADMMARAHRLDPEVTPAAAAQEAARYAPVVALPRRAPRRPAARSPWPRLGSLLGLAAALALGVGIGTAVRQAHREAAPASGHAAQLAPEAAASGQAVPGARASETPRERATVPATRVDRATDRAIPERMDPAITEDSSDPATADISSEPAIRGYPAGPARTDETANHGIGAPADREYLRIDRAADAAWRRGDRRRARALLDDLTRSPAPLRLVEAAFGDLGLLLRQDGDDAALERLWRRYLAKFPRGSFADDARAELCRRAGAPTECWRRYLRTLPRGAHAGEARGVLAERGSIADSVRFESSQVTHSQE